MKVPLKEVVSLAPLPPSLCNCRVSADTEQVTDHFKASGIRVEKVEKVSHESASRNSFVMIVQTREDYDKVLKGDIVPASVGVRR